MKLVTEPRDAIDLTTTPVHLGLGSRALAVDGFGWDARVPGDRAATLTPDALRDT